MELKELRKQNNLTQTEVGAYINASAAKVSTMENSYGLSYDERIGKRLAAAFDVDVSVVSECINWRKNR